MLRRVRSMRLLSLSALPYLALEAVLIATAWSAGGRAAAMTRALCITGAAVLAAAGGWWLSAPRPPGTRADRGRLAAVLPRIADGRAWVTSGQVLRCRPSGPASWELLVADRDQDAPEDLDAPATGLVPVTYTAYAVSRRAVSRRTSAWLMEPGPDGALIQPPAPGRSRRERAAAAIRVLRLSRAGLLDADAAEIAGLAADAAEAVRYSTD
jgi:hypothetical protein